MVARALGRLRELWFVAVFNAAVVPLALVGLHAADTDTFYRLANGRYMVEHVRILDREIFSFTIPDHPWTNYSWLFESLLYTVYRLGGFSAIIAFRAAIVVLTANLILLLVHRRVGRTHLITLATALLAFAVYVLRGQMVRPHLLSYLFLALTMVLLERMWRRPRAFEPWLPALYVVWANVHGVEYPIPLVAVGIYAAAAWFPHLRRPVAEVLADRDAIRWPALLASCALAFLVGPFGWRLLGTALMVADEEVMRHIAEMAPLDPRSLLDLYPHLDLNAKVAFRYALVATALALPVWIARRDVRGVLFALFGTLVATRRGRFVAEFAILVLPFVAGAAAELRRGLGRRAWLADGVALVLVAYLGLGVVTTVWTRAERGHFRELSATAYPIGAARFLAQERLGGNLFSSASIAGYVAWALHPDVRIAMDMRTPEPFDARMHWIMRTTREPVDLDRLARRWPIDLVLLERQAPLAPQLARAGDTPFALVYADHAFVVFAHRRMLDGDRARLELQALDPFDPTLEYVRRLRDPADRARLEVEIRRLLTIWPENRLARETDYARLMALGRASDAYAVTRELLAQAGHVPAYHHQAGLALRALGDDAAALPHLARALRLDPAFLPAYPALADTARALGRLPLALATMERYLRRKDYLLAPDEFLLLGALRAHAGHPAPAADAFQRALWLAPDAARAGLARLIAEPATPAAVRDVARARLEGVR